MSKKGNRSGVIAQCELFFKELVEQKNKVYDDMEFSSFTRKRGYIDGLEWCIERLGKILNMNEDDL